MKIEITTPPSPQKREMTFPVLAKYRRFNSELIVLFLGETRGIIVGIEKSDNRTVGYYQDNWFSVYDASKWEILPAGTKVTFIQE